MEPIRRYFLDTEFYPDADGHSHLISIGLIGEHDKGPGFYAIDAAFNAAACTHPWVNTHVVSKLDPATPRLARTQMADAVIDYLEPARKVEVWARNGSYDFYHLCQVFNDMGSLMDRIKQGLGVKRIDFRDINEIIAQSYPARIPHAPDEQAHVAIFDARWDRDHFPALERQAAINNARPGQIMRTIARGIAAALRRS